MEALNLLSYSKNYNCFPAEMSWERCHRWSQLHREFEARSWIPLEVWQGLHGDSVGTISGMPSWAFRWQELVPNNFFLLCSTAGGIRRHSTPCLWHEGDGTKCCLSWHQKFYSLDHVTSLISMQLIQGESESICLDFIFFSGFLQTAAFLASGSLVVPLVKTVFPTIIAILSTSIICYSKYFYQTP